MVRLGVRSGVPDLCLPVPVVGMVDDTEALWCGLWLELKHGAGDVSPAQERWLRTLSANGYAIALAWSVDEAQAALLAYLDGKGTDAHERALAYVGDGPVVA